MIRQKIEAEAHPLFFLPSLSEPLVPGQRVLVFPYPNASGATLGWYGNVISGRFPVGYHVLFDGRECFVRPEDLLAIDEVDQELARERRTVWVAVDGQIADDQPEICGQYYRQGRNWSKFRFTKEERVVPHWELRLPALPSEVADPSLYYQVPAAWRLDIHLLFRVFKQLLGMPRLWPSRDD